MISAECTKPYWEEEAFKDLSYDEVIRFHVYMLIKYAGRFERMIMADFHTSNKYKGNFWYRASPKLPLQYTLQVSPPNVRKLLIEKYLENPLNPLTLVEYD